MFSILMFFAVCFLVGLVIPFLLFKVKSKGLIWLPTLILVVGTILMAIKAFIFPGDSMADLGERVYMIMLVLSTIGSLIGALIVSLFKK